MSSKRRLRRKECTSKDGCYPSLAAAIDVSMAIRRRGKPKLSAYQCRWCGMFHLGHMPYRVAISIADKKRNKEKGIGKSQ